MRFRFLSSMSLFLSFLFFLPSCNRVETSQERSSYAKGFAMGLQFRRDQEEIDESAYLLGLQDALKKGVPRITIDQMENALSESFAERTERSQKQIAKNQSDSEKFLKNNSTRSGVQNTTTGLQYEIQKEGSGSRPTAQDFVRVKYKAKLISGEEFESSPEQGVLVPMQGTMPGWVEGLQLMKVGSQFTLYLPPQLGFGPAARGKVLPQSALIYEMELMAIEAPPQPAPPEKAKKPQSPAKKR